MFSLLWKLLLRPPEHHESRLPPVTGRRAPRTGHSDGNLEPDLAFLFIYFLGCTD